LPGGNNPKPSRQSYFRPALTKAEAERRRVKCCPGWAALAHSNDSLFTYPLNHAPTCFEMDFNGSKNKVGIG
jgi:hypothetical protein